MYESFNLESAKKIKEEEAVTNHDVKAVEYFVKKEMDKLGLGEFREWVHFSLTSQDVNNTAIPLLLKVEFIFIFARVDQHRMLLRRSTDRL